MTDTPKPRRALAPAPMALLYIRVSTSKQAEHGVGLETQLARCTAHAARLELPVFATFRDEGLSGKDGVADRPGLRALVDAVRLHPHATVIVYSVSRLARRQRLLWQLLDDRDGYGLHVVSATEPFDAASPMGRAMLGMIAVFAQLEADMVSERTVDALAELRAQGVRLGSPPILETPAFEPTLRLVHSLYASKAFTHRTLAEELNRRAVPSARGGKWWPKTVRDALLTPIAPKG